MNDLLEIFCQSSFVPSVTSCYQVHALTWCTHAYLQRGYATLGAVADAAGPGLNILGGWSCLLTHIGIVILTTKKYFLHRALLFSLWVVKLYFCCIEITNELHNVQGARPSGPAKYYHQSELSGLITSQLRIKLTPE